MRNQRYEIHYRVDGKLQWDYAMGTHPGEAVEQIENRHEQLVTVVAVIDEDEKLVISDG